MHVAMTSRTHERRRSPARSRVTRAQPARIGGRHAVAARDSRPPGMASVSLFAIVCVLVMAAVVATPAAAAIRVNPEGVNVNAQGATSVFVTFGGLDGYTPAEAEWCGALVSLPDGTARCDPATIYGLLPARYDRSRIGATNAMTDIMSIPPSVARRAYQAAAAGRSAEFFYVRRFVKAGAPDQFVHVTCRLTGGGARVPLSLVDVRLAFATDTPVLFVRTGDVAPPVTASIEYTGTGPLRGRWEVVLPGQNPPTPDDLLTEATLPLDLRGTQHRYAEIERFDVFLAPTGRYTLAGPDPARLPTGVSGQYLLLLRIEASDDKEADSDLSAIGAGNGIVHAGAVAGFPMPTLRYIVGDTAVMVPSVTDAPLTSTRTLTPSAATASVSPGHEHPNDPGLSPPDGAALRTDPPIDLRWPRIAAAAYYRVELTAGSSSSSGDIIHRAVLPADAISYRLPPFVLEKAAGRDVIWRVIVVDAEGHEREPWNARRLAPAAGAATTTSPPPHDP
jgi:hypothetical protein